MKTKKIPAYVLRLPRKGNFAPIKVGCMEAKFIRTKMPNGMEDMWIADSKIHTDIDVFNEMCQRVTPSAYKYKLAAFAFVFEIDVVEETPPAPALTPPVKQETPSMSQTGLSEKADDSAPSLPLPSPPTPAKKVAPKAAKKAAKKAPTKE